MCKQEAPCTICHCWWLQLGMQLVALYLRCPAACRDALRYIALREDFKMARVDGKPLAALFSGEGIRFE